MSLQNIQMIILPTPGPATSHLWRVICAGGAVHLLKASQDPASPDNLSPHGISPCAQRAWAFISPSRQPQQRNMIVMGFFLRFFFYLKVRITRHREEWERGREREGREREVFHPLNDHNTQSWAGMKLGSRRFFQISHVCARRQSTWATLCCFSRHISQELDQEWSSRDSNWHPYRMRCPVCKSNFLHHGAGPNYLDFHRGGSWKTEVNDLLKNHILGPGWRPSG